MFGNVSNEFHTICPVYLWLPVKLMCEDFQQPLTLEKREEGEREREGGHLRVGGSPGRGYPAN